MILRSFCVLSLLAMSLTVLAVPTAVAAPSTSETFDILYLSDLRPVAIRLDISIDDKPLQASWDHFVDLLFAKLDVDKNGSVDEKESSRLRAILVFLTAQTQGPNGDLPPPPKNMGRAELGDYLRKHDFGPLRLPPPVNQAFRGRQFRRGGQPKPEQLDKAILELLDTNNDGRISVAEFTAGVEILSRLDTNEDEMISVDELLRRPASSPFFVEEDLGPSPGKGPGVELVSLSARGTDVELARRLLTRYGIKPPEQQNYMMAPMALPPRQRMQQAGPISRRLTKKELNLSDQTFELLDQDENEELDSEELARYGQAVRPEVEIALRLGKSAGGSRPAELRKTGIKPLNTFVSPRGSEVVLDIPGVRLDLMVPTGTDTDALKTAFRNRYLNRFRNLDRDANGYLDTNEANNDQLFRELFSFLDKDGDRKIFLKELVATLDEYEGLVIAASSAFFSVELNEAGQGLFGLIDSDGDGRLSVRELRNMAKLVERFASTKEGGLAASDVPRRFEATLHSGLGSFGQQNVRVNPGMPGGIPRPQVGPLWFQKMDRNRDGDVSRREFIGSDEDFRKLDLDGDGLISLEEAELAEKKR